MAIESSDEDIFGDKFIDQFDAPVFPLKKIRNNKTMPVAPQTTKLVDDSEIFDDFIDFEDDFQMQSKTKFVPRKI